MAVLLERSWTGFFFGSRFALFVFVEWAGSSVAHAICTDAMWTALFAGPAAATPTAAYIAAGAIGALATAVSVV